MSSTQGGPTLQLAAYGAQDLYLTGNPQITNFKASVQRHTNFSIESIQLYFTGDPNFGKKVYCPLLRIGDLINKIYLYMELPPLLSNPPEGLLVSWVNAIGFMMIRSIDIQIGEHVVDKQYGQWMFIWSELTSDANKKDAFHRMIGYTPDCHITNNGSLQLYIPLFFWFCRDSGSSLPLIALQYQDIRIALELRDFNQLWISNNPEQAKPLIGEKQPLNAWLMVDYIFLDTEERRWFAQNKHYYLIQQVQSTTVSIDIKKAVNVIDLPFNHPVKELIWVYQGKAVQDANEWTNFSNTLQSPLSVTCNPILNIQNSAVLRFEGTDRFKEQPSKFFNTLQPYQYHTAVPNESLFINVYSFALRPELLQPTGSANFSRLDNVTLHVDTMGANQETDIAIYALNYNIFRIMGGLSGVLFTD